MKRIQHRGKEPEGGCSSGGTGMEEDGESPGTGSKFWDEGDPHKIVTGVGHMSGVFPLALFYTSMLDASLVWPGELMGPGGIASFAYDVDVWRSDTSPTRYKGEPNKSLVEGLWVLEMLRAYSRLSQHQAASSQALGHC